MYRFFKPIFHYTFLLAEHRETVDERAGKQRTDMESRASLEEIWGSFVCAAPEIVTI